MKKVFYVLWAIAFLFGVFAVYQKFTHGDLLVNFGSRVVWGLWVAMYIYFIGLSAGAFLLSSLVYVFKMKVFEKLGKLALITALITLICALLSIWFDLGHQWRFFEVFTTPNLPSSMMAWMIWLYTAYFLLLLGETLLAFRIDSGKLTGAKLVRKQRTLQILASVGIPLAIAFHGGVGALFGVVASNPIWHSALTPIYFLVGAILSGCALLTMIFVFLWKDKASEDYRKISFLLGRIVLVTVLFDLLLEWSELSIAMWLGRSTHIQGFKDMLYGHYWYVFWIIHILLGVIIPVVIFLVKSKKPYWVGLASLLVVFTFLGVRLNIVIPGLVTPKIPGMASAFFSKRLLYSYSPSSQEWLVGLFIVTLGIALFYLGDKYLKLTNPHN
jgi:molybdopterin-containing oxidoreductase family membrane subunit